MEIKHFIIENYRAIKKVKISLRDSLVPIIGINESGKTSVLQAILAFDFRKDKYNGGSHLEYQNKYSTIDTKDSSISAKLTLTEDEVELLIANAKVQTDTDDYKELSKINSKTELLIKRILSEDKHYEYVNTNLTEQTVAKVTNFLKQRFPYILYFDDFTDRVPESIKFNSAYIDNGKLTRGRKREWEEIIEEIFKRSGQENINEAIKPLQTYMSISDEDRKTDILSDVQNMLNTVIISEWKNLKNKGNASLADDSTDLELILENSGNNFKFKVKDKSNQNKSRTFAIGSRSKGFQWFFNYMVKLKFNPDYGGQIENALFLLDEPGSYLHSSAQTELLKELKTVSNNNKVVFCTHSQFLLDPKVVKLGSIKIAEKKQSEIKVSNYGEYKSKEDKGALTPIYQALQLNFSQDFIGKVVILEGITDFYIFDLLKQNKYIDSSIKFIPSAGAETSSIFISLSIAFADNYLLLLDNDKDGQKAKNRYIKQFGEAVKNNIIFYNEENNFKLESFISASQKKDILSKLDTKDIKKALSFLYYSDDKNYQQKIMAELSKDKNLEKIILQVNNLLH